MEKLTLEEILERFQNGEQRYDKDAYFKEAITAIHLGVGIYAVLDRVLKEHLILMNLHNEAVNKNRVAVGEIARLTDDGLKSGDRSILMFEANNEIGRLKGELARRSEAHNESAANLSKAVNQIQIMEDELASLTEALQHYQK